MPSSCFFKNINDGQKRATACAGSQPIHELSLTIGGLLLWQAIYSPGLCYMSYKSMGIEGAQLQPNQMPFGPR